MSLPVVVLVLWPGSAVVLGVDALPAGVVGPATALSVDTDGLLALEMPSLPAPVMGNGRVLWQDQF